MINKLYAITLALLFTVHLQGQEVQFEKKEYGQLEGLFAQTVHCIHQDSFGYLVLGTENGVFLFDGHNFFRPEYHDQIESKRIEAIQNLAPNSYLLLGGSPNAAYMVENDQIVWKRAFSGTRNMPQRFYYEPKSKNIYFKDGKLLYTAPIGNSNKLQTCLEWSNPIISFIVDAEENVYIWDLDETLSYVANGQIRRTHTFSDKTLIWKLVNQADGSIVAWTQDSLLVLNDGNILKGLTHNTPVQLVIRNMGNYPDGSLWFTEGSSDLFVYGDGKIINQNNDFGFENTILNCVLKDANETYWIGTEKSGLIRVRASNAKLISKSNNLKINTIASNKKYILVGTRQGILSYSEGALHKLRSGADYFTKSRLVFDKNLTHKIAFGQEHWLISSMQTQVVRQKGIKPEKVLGNDAIIQNGPSMFLFPNCLAHGFWGSFSISPIKENTIGEKTKFRGSFGRTNEFVPLPQDFLAVCDRNIFLIAEDEFHQYDTTSILGPNTIAQGIVYNDVEVKEDTWYIATSKGVFKTQYNQLTRNIEQVEQLSFTESKCIQFVGNNLWIGTTNGLFKYSEGVISPFLIVTKSGTPSITSLFFNEKEGKLLIGTMKGLFEINPFQPTPKDQLLRMGSHTLVLDGIPQRSNFETVELEHDQNTFDIQVPILNFLHPLKAEIMYSLNDRAPEKSNSGIMRFNSLEPNQYQIKIWGETADGQKTVERLLSVRIKKPIWKTPWFLILMTLLLVVVSLLVLYYRGQQLKKRTKIELETRQLVNELEKKALNLSLNPHFLFNSLNSIQSKISSFNDEDLVNYIADFSNLMRKVLVNSDRSLIGLNEEIVQLELYIKMEQRRHPNKIDYSIEVSDQVREQEFKIPPMLLQPFVENSILHGILPSKDPGHILVEAAMENSFLHLLIKDNGVGLHHHKKPKQHASKGLDITRKRILLQHPNNTITVADRDDSSNETGVVIEIKLWMGD